MMYSADNWCVKVQDRVYGPYTTLQLRKFAHEGRFAAWSLIAPAGSRSWRAAKDEASFAAFFGDTPRTVADEQPRSFGRRGDAGAPAAGTDSSDAPAPIVINRPAGRRNAGAAVAADKSIANFVVIFDVVSAAATRVEPAILTLGPAFRLAENVWTVSCELTAIGVRNAIAPYLLAREPIFVVDTTRGRSSWQNFTPETHAKLAAAWAGAKQCA